MADSPGSKKLRVMDRTNTAEDTESSVKKWDKKEDKKYDLHRYMGNSPKFFFKQIADALNKKGVQ